VHYSGFMLNDGPSSLTGTLSCGTAATVNNGGQVLSPAGTYAITCAGLSSANYTITYTAGTLTVTPENAVVKLAANNPAALQVTKAGGTAPQFTLGATIAEVSDGSYGDITKASPLTFTLTPLGGGAGSSCTVPSASGAVTKVLAATATSPGSETVSCTFPAGTVGVNVYDVNVSVGATSYLGAADGALTVFDMSQTGVQWGGGTVVNPVTGNAAAVAFSASYKSGGGVSGKLMYVETDSKGNQTVLKGNNLATMAITKSSTGGYPETATITGKACSMAWATTASCSWPWTPREAPRWTPTSLAFRSRTRPAPRCPRSGTPPQGSSPAGTSSSNEILKSQPCTYAPAGTRPSSTALGEATNPPVRHESRAMRHISTLSRPASSGAREGALPVRMLRNSRASSRSPPWCPSSPVLKV
jgi:hypothetical protein